MTVPNADHLIPHMISQHSTLILSPLPSSHVCKASFTKRLQGFCHDWRSRVEIRQDSLVSSHLVLSLCQPLSMHWTDVGETTTHLMMHDQCGICHRFGQNLKTIGQIAVSFPTHNTPGHLIAFRVICNCDSYC